jgi:hypothetical protein
MARTAAGLPEGTRPSDFVTLGVVTEKIPTHTVRRVLREVNRESERMRQLPAHVMVYYVIALALYMHVSYGEVLRCVLEGLEWLGQPVRRLRQTGRSGISQARSRLGHEPMHRLYEEVVQPLATEATRGAWYRSPAGKGATPRAWRLVSVDGSTLDLPDEASNEETFGRPSSSRGRSAFPKLRFVALGESGTHVIFGAAEGAYAESEVELARQLLPRLEPDMLLMADRGFFGYQFWNDSAATGADLLWRVKWDMVLPRLTELADGSYLSEIYASSKHRHSNEGGITVRVIEYMLEDDAGEIVIPKKNPYYRLITTIVDAEAAPAEDMARRYHERWEAENAFDELKTHLRGASIVLRSKTPTLVRQEFYGLLLAHYAVRALMHEAALKADLDPDALSFVHSVRVIRRKIQAQRNVSPRFNLDGDPFPPSGNFDAS